MYQRPHELTRMGALNCTLLDSLDAIKIASSLTVFSLQVFLVCMYACMNVFILYRSTSLISNGPPPFRLSLSLFHHYGTVSAVFMLIGVFVSSPYAGSMMLLGVIVSTLTAILMGVDQGSVENGLFGYNGSSMLLFYLYNNLLLFPLEE